MAEVNEDWTTTGVSAATPGSTDGADKPVVCVLLQQAKSSNETRVIVGVLGDARHERAWKAEEALEA